jgi:hypothetical protein
MPCSQDERSTKTLKEYTPKPIDEENHTKLQAYTKCVVQDHSGPLMLRSGRERLVIA